MICIYIQKGINFEKYNQTIKRVISVSSNPEYSKSNNNILLPTFLSNNDHEFYDWFRGFCDAEGNFIIRVRKKKEKIIGFEFLFRITLHKDDLNVLKIIKSKFNCGSIINSNRNVHILIVSSLNDIENAIIPFFDKYPLMTKKCLDYLDFKQAFFIFKKRKKDKENRSNYDSQIIEIKNRMNDKRFNCSLPNRHIKITSDYLLGYLEGDGSFYFNKHDNTVRISLITITEDRIILEKIKEFLFNQFFIISSK
jgi:hypothetical protein